MRFLVMVNESRDVALLAEGVDRNLFENGLFSQICESPSSRRAWIEIVRTDNQGHGEQRRPPRGGRG